MEAELGSSEYGAAPAKFHMEVTISGESLVTVVPESMTILIGMGPAIATMFPPASVPDTPFKLMVKSTTLGNPSNPEASRSIEDHQRTC